MNEELKIVLATSNKDKLRDFSDLLKDLNIKLRLPEEIVDIDESKDSLLENAKLKALVYSKIYPDKLVLATDGGVLIPFLKNWNHVLTKRLSGRDMKEKLTGRDRCKVLLDMMKDAKGEDRRVFWKEAYSIAKNGSVLYEFESKSPPGYLLEEIPKDFEESGYWIGYLWYKPKFGKHYMALSKEEKLKADTAGKLFKQNLKEKMSSIVND